MTLTILGHRRHRNTTGYALLDDAHFVETAEHVGSIIAAAKQSIQSQGCGISLRSKSIFIKATYKLGNYTH